MPKLRKRRFGELVRQFQENGVKLMFEHPANLRDVLRVLRVAWLDEIDFSRLVQVKTTFIRRDYRHLQTDLVFTAPWAPAGGRARHNLLIYILLEHQSEPDRLMPLRLADSQVQILRYQVRQWLQVHSSPARMRLSPVLPVVVYTGLRRWPAVGTLADLIERGDEFREVTPIVERPLFFNLPELDAAKLERDGGLFGWVLRLFQERRSRAEEFEPLLARVVSHLDRMPSAEQQRLVELLSYIRAMLYHERSEGEQRRLQQVMEQSVQSERTRQEVIEMGRTMADVLIERGRKEGERKGELKGERKAGLQIRQQTLLRLLRRRFGDVLPDVVSAVESTGDVDRLDNWLDRLVTVQTLDELGIGDSGE
jgi:hypothetical protein